MSTSTDSAPALAIAGNGSGGLESEPANVDTAVNAPLNADGGAKPVNPSDHVLGDSSNSPQAEPQSLVIHNSAEAPASGRVRRRRRRRAVRPQTRRRPRSHATDPDISTPAQQSEPSADESTASRPLTPTDPGTDTPSNPAALTTSGPGPVADAPEVSVHSGPAATECMNPLGTDSAPSGPTAPSQSSFGAALSSPDVVGSACLMELDQAVASALPSSTTPPPPPPPPPPAHSTIGKPTSSMAASGPARAEATNPEPAASALPRYRQASPVSFTCQSKFT